MREESEADGQEQTVLDQDLSEGWEEQVAERRDVALVGGVPVRAVGNRILARRLNRVTESQGGIIIPQKYRKSMLEAVVLAVGPGEISPKTHIRRPIDVEPGDHIFFQESRGLNASYGGWDCIFLTEEDVFGAVGQQ